MSKHRSVDPDFWTSPKMRRYPWHCRMLLSALITTIADDEGRFDLTAYGLLDAIFSRQDPVTEDDIAADLAQLEADGVILVYGPDRQFGFLTAWYRRQIIDKRLRQPSGRPEPPVTPASPITSWAFADALAGASIAGSEKSRAWTAVACREFEALDEQERDAVRAALKVHGKEPFFTEQYRNLPSDVTRRDVTRLDVTAGRAREDEPEPTARPTEPEPMASVPEPVAPATPTPPDPATEHDPSTLPPDLDMQKLNHGTLSAAVRKALSGRTQAKRSDQWFADLLAFTRDYPDQYTEVAIVDALSRDPPKAADKFADRWLERVMPRASPPDPALSPIQAEIAKYGRALTATERADLKDREARARAG